jgi:hypothetical protein
MKEEDDSKKQMPQYLIDLFSMVELHGVLHRNEGQVN